MFPHITWPLLFFLAHWAVYVAVISGCIEFHRPVRCFADPATGDSCLQLTLDGSLTPCGTVQIPVWCCVNFLIS